MVLQAMWSCPPADHAHELCLLADHVHEYVSRIRIFPLCSAHEAHRQNVTSYTIGYHDEDHCIQDSHPLMAKSALFPNSAQTKDTSNALHYGMLSPLYTTVFHGHAGTCSTIPEM